MSEKILVVDDESDLELLIKQRFRKQIRENVFDFVFASNGREALNKLQEHPDVRIIMTDINMPEMDGLALLENIKPIDRPLKTIVVSAYNDLQNIRTAMNRGAFDFVTKPVDFGDFESTIKKSLEELNFILASIQTKKQLEQEREERERAEQKEQMEQRFLANMSHEIRTPINAIHGMTKLMLMKEQPEGNLTYLNGIRQSCENLMVIVNDILDLSKIEAGKVEFEKIPFDVRETMKLVTESLRFKADEKHVALILSVTEEVPKRVLGDPTRISQILTNLIGNAVKFTSQGEVRLEVSCVLETTDANTENPKCRLICAVADSGIGMNEEQLSKIFQRFTQASSETTRKFGGTGLGLTISKQLIEMQGGQVRVSSEANIGTTFTFEISYEIAGDEMADKQESKADAATIEKVGKMKIILAEDNDFNQMVAVGLLKELVPGITIDCVWNGRELIDKISQQQYDLILMDVQMPEMDGVEATKKIRSDNNPIPIIAMTAGITKDELVNCTNAGANDVVAKPFNPEELIIKIATLGAR